MINLLVRTYSIKIDLKLTLSDGLQIVFNIILIYKVLKIRLLIFRVKMILI